MEAENSKYVDSISGKLNQLKETWVSIGTTIVSSDFTKGFLDGAIKVSEAIDSIVKALDGMNMLTPMLTGFGLSFASMIKSISSGSGSSFGVLTTLNKDLDKSGTLMQKVKTVGGNAFSYIGKGISSAGKYLVSFVTQGLAIAGVTIAVQALAKAWDYATNGLKNAEKEIRNSIDEINDKLNSDNKNLNYLESTSEKYDELIKKKKEYGNTPIENMTDEQIADMEELKRITSELAQMSPELVIGYDSDGSPIMMMADDMEKLKKRTQEQIDLNKELLKMERQKLANNAREQVQKGDLLGSSTNLDVARDSANLEDSYNRKMALENEYINAIKSNNKLVTSNKTKELQKEEKKLQEYYDRSLQSYQDYSQKELTIQQATFDQVQAMKGYDKLDGDNLTNVQGFIDNINWANLDEGQYNKWVNSFDKVIELANSGSPKLKEWNDTLELAKDKYAATENLDSYKESLSGLAKTISEDLNIDYDTVFSGLENMVKPLTESEKKMNSFLESFGKTRYDLLNGDNIAMQLAEQFQAVDDVVNTMLTNKEYAFKANGALTFDMMTDIANKDEIPDQIQSLANELAKGGVTKAESDLMLEIMMAINSGDKAQVESAIENVNSKLKELGMEEHTIDIKTLFDETGVTEAEDKVNNVDGKEAEVTITTKEEGVDEAVDKIDEVEEKTNSDKTLSIKTNDDEILNSIDDIETLIKLSAEVGDGKYKLDIEANTADAITNIDKFKESVNNLSNQVSQMKSSVNIKIETSTAAKNISGLLVRIDQAKKAMSGNLKATFVAETAQSAKNISGLITRINQAKALCKTYTVKFNAETALAAKNITGLINKINSVPTGTR